MEGSERTRDERRNERDRRKGKKCVGRRERERRTVRDGMEEAVNRQPLFNK